MAHAVDVHQHLWPAELVDRLRARSAPPCLRGWTLHLRGRAPQPVDAAHHDVAARIAQDRRDGVGSAWLALDPALAEAELADAWHDGVRRLGPHHRAWLPVEADLGRLATRLADGGAGLQLSAPDVGFPAGWQQVAPALAVAEAAGRPVLVHPGPRPTGPGAASGSPGWWQPVVDDVAQLQAAWWSWHVAGVRAQLGSLRVVFAAGAGLAPVLHERRTASGGERLGVDRDVFVDTAGCGPQALDALVRVLGIDVLVSGSDRPHTEPFGSTALDRALGDAATHAVRVANPARLLDGPPRTPGTTDRPTTTGTTPHPREEQTWPRAS